MRRTILGMAKSSLDLRGAKAQKLELDLLRLVYAVDRIRHTGEEAQGYLLVMTLPQAARVEVWLAKYMAGDSVRVLVADPRDENRVRLEREKARNIAGMVAAIGGERTLGRSSGLHGQTYGEDRLRELIQELEPGVTPATDAPPLGVRWDYFGQRDVSG